MKMTVELIAPDRQNRPQGDEQDLLTGRRADAFDVGEGRDAGRAARYALRRSQSNLARSWSSSRIATGSTCRGMRLGASHPGAGSGPSTSTPPDIGAGCGIRPRRPWRVCAKRWRAVHRTRSQRASLLPRDICASSCARNRRAPASRSTRRSSRAVFASCGRGRGVWCSRRCPGRFPIRRGRARVPPVAYARESLLTEEELASEVRRTIATVRRWRVEGMGPVLLRIARAVRYSRVDREPLAGRTADALTLSLAWREFRGHDPSGRGVANGHHEMQHHECDLDDRIAMF